MREPWFDGASAIFYYKNVAALYTLIRVRQFCIYAGMGVGVDGNV